MAGFGLKLYMSRFNPCSCILYPLSLHTIHISMDVSFSVYVSSHLACDFYICQIFAFDKIEDLRMDGGEIELIKPLLVP